MPLSIPPERMLPPAEIDCKWWKQGYCARGKKCYFRHDEAMAGVDNKPTDGRSRPIRNGKASMRGPLRTDEDGSSSHETSSPAQICTICLETPDTFGLLLNCDHVFCLECIRDWRASTRAPLPMNEELKDTTKTCPLCRAHSDFIIPSSEFPTAPEAVSTHGVDNTAKKEIVDRYLKRLTNIPCRYFEKSVEAALDSTDGLRPRCKFGNGCHYAHKHPITKEPYLFSESELNQSRKKPRQRRPRISADDMAIMEAIFTAFEDGYSDDELGCDDDDLLFFEGSSTGLRFGLDLGFEEFEDTYGWD